MAGKLDIIMPGLCGPLPRHTELPRDDILSQLSAMLGRPQAAADAYLVQLQRCLRGDDAATTDGLPVAALMHMASSDIHASECLLVEPAHLKADMDHALLIDQSSIGVSEQEKQQLLTELNAHFEQDGIEITSDDAGNWYIVSDVALGIDTVPLHDVIARNVNLFMPQGERASDWKRFLNEAQMLLHMSQVNVRRVESGLIPVNSVWLWGEGALSAETYLSSLAERYDRLVGDDRLHAGIARLAGLPFTKLTDDSRPQPGERVLLCDTSMLRLAASGDIDGWYAMLRRRAQGFLEPVISAARKGGVDTVVYPCAGKYYQPTSRRLLDIFSKMRKTGSVICYDD